MKALLITIVVLCAVVGSAVAQKKSTLLGDIVIGELAGRDEATREITIKYPGKAGTEMFSGILADDSRLKSGMSGGRDLMLSEIAPGMYIRVFYKTRNEKIGGQEKKINKISRLEVLGEDQFYRIRKELNLTPATVIATAENGDDLASTSPLKVYLSIPYDHVHQKVLAWLEKWNQKNGDSLGKLQIVSDLDQADTLIVVAVGSDTLVAELPAEIYDDGDRFDKGVWSQATSYLIVKDAGRLKVLWTNIAVVLVNKNNGISPRAVESLTAEIERRIKARARNSKK